MDRIENKAVFSWNLGAPPAFVQMVLQKDIHGVVVGNAGNLFPGNTGPRTGA